MIVRLCDVAPDGTSGFISFGLLNLRHRYGFDRKGDLEPGQLYDVEVTLDQTAYRLPKGHRLRVAISNSYWPYCWPEGRSFKLTLSAGLLELPMHQSPDQAFEPQFDAPIDVEERAYRVLRAATEAKTRNEDQNSGRITLKLTGDHGRREDLENGLITDSDMTETWEIKRDNPASAHVEIVWNRGLAREGEFSVRSRVVTRMWGQEDQFFIQQKLEAWDGDTLIFEKNFQDSIDR
jgi:hypothetical protein